MFSPLTKELIVALQGLPGVGPKSAQRLAFHVLGNGGKNKGLALAEALQQAISQVSYCRRCRNYTEDNECDVCRNPKRNPQLLCVVESPADAAAIEQTGSYHGHYFILHGHLSPLDGIGPEEIGIPTLLQRLAEPQLKELILAINLTVEGNATTHYITKQVSSAISCSRIAHGVPLGGELEYLDGGTLSHAFRTRTPLNQEATHDNSF